MNHSPFNRLARKLLTRPVHHFERKRPYPLLSSIWALPPLPASQNSTGTLLALTTPDKVAEAAWTAYSFGVWNPQLALKIAVDGAFSDDDADRVRRVLPGEAIARLDGLLDAETVGRPGIRRLVEGHRLGRKLGLILCQQRRSNVIYADSDVLCFKAPDEGDCDFTDASPRYMLEEDGSSYDPVLVEHLARLGSAPPERVNSGFLVLPKDSLDIEAADRLLADAEFDPASWFTEQTFVAAMMRVSNGRPLPREKYLLTNRRQFYFEQDVDYDAAVLRHFTGPTRHLYYSKGLPLIRAAARQQGPQ